MTHVSSLSSVHWPEQRSRNQTGLRVPCANRDEPGSVRVGLAEERIRCVMKP